MMVINYKINCYCKLQCLKKWMNEFRKYNRLNETKSNNSDCNKVNEQVNPEGKGFAVDEIRWAKSGVIIGIFQPIFVLVIVAIFVLVSAIFVAVFLATLFLAVVICDFIVFWKMVIFFCQHNLSKFPRYFNGSAKILFMG